MRLMLPGIMSVNICLPVQSGLGLRMAGWGILPSQEGSHINRFITDSCVGSGGDKKIETKTKNVLKINKVHTKYTITH